MINYSVSLKHYLNIISIILILFFEVAKGTNYHPGKKKVRYFTKIFSQIVPIRVRKLCNTNFIPSRQYIKKEKALLLIDIHCSNSPFLKLPMIGGGGGVRGIIL